MIINAESPLRKIPSSLNMKQTLFLDAIRYSVEMSDIAYYRLQNTLLSLTFEHMNNSEAKSQMPSESIILDAWSIIDSIHRLRILLEQLPYLKQKSSGLLSFYKHTEGIEYLRNIMQHINHEVDFLTENKIPVLGSLSWIACPEPDKRLYLCNLQTGTLFKRSVPIIKMPKSVRIPIDKITLIHKESLCLSDVMAQVVKLTASIETQLKKQMGDLPQAGADLLVILEIKPRETPLKNKTE